jgi:ubiquinone biosynthesis protein
MTGGRAQGTTKPFATPKARREEVAARLAAYGLARGPHRVVRGGTRAEAGAGFGHRLRLALEGLGPVFSLFGLYLATRVDLLDAPDCRELAALRDAAPPLPAAEAHELFRQGVGLAPGDVFLEFEGEPCESRLLQQSHRARLRDGSPVVVRLVRPEAERQTPSDVELLDLLAGALAGVGVGGPSFESAVADFTSALGRQLDLTHEAKALTALAHDAADFQMLAAPCVHAGLCSARVLTVAELTGRRLDGAESARAYAGGWERWGRRGLPKAHDTTALARLLCAVWLRQALLGHAFPVEPGAANVLFVGERQVAFTGGHFESLHAEAQASLWNYLLATAADDPDRACAELLGELRHEGRAGEDLRHRFRQVVPFRDTGWHLDDDTNHLAEHLVVHWRSAAECGYVPRAHLAAFYRGLFAVTGAARQLSPDGDPLLEGLQDARLDESLTRAREWMSPRQFGNHADNYAAMMLSLPGRLDEVLSLGSGGGPRLKVRAPEAPRGRRRENSASAVNALLLLLAAAVVLLPRATAALFEEAWAERIDTVVFIMLGALLLRGATRAA